MLKAIWKRCKLLSQAAYVVVVWSAGNSDPEREGSSGDSQEKLLSESSVPPADSPRDSGCYESSENLENGNDSLPRLWLSSPPLPPVCDLCMNPVRSAFIPLSLLWGAHVPPLGLSQHLIHVSHSSTSVSRHVTLRWDFTSVHFHSRMAVFCACWICVEPKEWGSLVLNQYYSLLQLEIWSHKCSFALV